ncbi:hypothetical protein Sango_0011000 [Sesamum angolense]|uniref:Retrotransposon gag domain-containing protein n=1 Tax=Sesamum angolense TaxID=2727404 RepID=A0AAE1XCL6_9LAMI|nr:hypothetical protein Sango_0011000 [Sesamum angolense]
MQQAGTYGDHLVKQFVRSLKDNAFDWYTDLEAGSINGWEQLEQEFLNRFYNTRRTVSMVKITNSRQWKEEPVVDYINRHDKINAHSHKRQSESSDNVEGAKVEESEVEEWSGDENIVNSGDELDSNKEFDGERKKRNTFYVFNPACLFGPTFELRIV